MVVNIFYVYLQSKLLKMSKIKDYLDSLTEEDMKNLRIRFVELHKKDKDLVPKGWVDINVHLPYCRGIDFMVGTECKVKTADGQEFISRVFDSLVWKYVMLDENVTHWYNE